jgi:Ni,Fe-hydrogenase I cytochrome b subunit
LHPSYLLATIVAILATELVSATILPKISFVIIVGKRDIKKMFVLPSSRNGYIDDILVHSKGFLHHLAHLEELFNRLHEINMKIHFFKCEFVVTSIVYLGHKILPNGIMAHWAKIVAIFGLPNPINVHTLKSLIGKCNYYMIYVQDFSTIAHPLYALLKKDVIWT